MSSSSDDSDSDFSDSDDDLINVKVSSSATGGGASNFVAQAAAKSTTTKKKSYYSDSSDDDDDDLSSMDSDDSYFKPKKKPPPAKKVAPPPPQTKTPPEPEKKEEQPPEKKEEQPPKEEEEEPAFEETTSDWFELIKLQKKNKRKAKLNGARLTWEEQEPTICEFYPESSVRTITDSEHVDEEHDEVPWHEQEYEELPWWEQPDLDEDDELTSLCKKVMDAGDSELDKAKTEAVESTVINFALKLKNKSLFRKKNVFGSLMKKKNGGDDGKDDKDKPKEEEGEKTIAADVEKPAVEDKENTNTENQIPAAQQQHKDDFVESKQDDDGCDEEGGENHAGNLPSCIRALASEDRDVSIEVRLPCQLSHQSRELMDNLVNELRNNPSTLRDVSIVIPSGVSEDFILGSGMDGLMATVGSLEDLEKLRIESSSDDVVPVLPTSYISHALKIASERENSQLADVSISKLKLSDSEGHISELTAALCTLNAQPKFKSSKFSVEFLPSSL